MFIVFNSLTVDFLCSLTVDFLAFQTSCRTINNIFTWGQDKQMHCRLRLARPWRLQAAHVTVLCPQATLKRPPNLIIFNHMSDHFQSSRPSLIYQGLGISIAETKCIAIIKHLIADGNDRSYCFPIEVQCCLHCCTAPNSSSVY